MLSSLLSTNKIFGTKHLIIVAVCAVVIALGYVFSRRLSLKTVCKIFFGVGIISEIVKIFYYIIANEEKLGGYLPKTDLPFHLCSIQIIFIAVLNISGNQKLKRFLLSFMLPSCFVGGIAAILIATTSSLNTWVITFQYFIYHVTLVIFSMHLFTSKEITFTAKDYLHCLEFLLGLMFFAIYINGILYDGESNINFMYVVSPPQDGLPFLTEKYGWGVYIAHYACTILAAVTACYVKPLYVAIKGLFDKNKPQPRPDFDFDVAEDQSSDVA